MWEEPSADNLYLLHHASMLVRSFRHWLGRDLVADSDEVEQARLVWEAPFAVVSHNTEPDPRFNYANRTALRVFEMTWDQFTLLPSRQSAPPVHQDERALLMATVAQRGHATNYRGVRITRSGQRFWLEDGIIWNVLDEQGRYQGQAAMFGRWTPIRV